MGGIVGGLVGAAGSIIGGNAQARAAKVAQQTALTGYNYLTNGAGSGYANQLMGNGQQANGAMAQLLGMAPVTSQTQNGFNNYLNSTGYNFQLGQGTNAIASNAAAAGTLNSGGTLKALEQYGQGLGGQYFNNYLGQLGGLAAQGQQTLGQIGSAGSMGAYAAAPAAQGTAAAGQSYANALTGLGGSIASYYKSPPGGG